MSSLLPPGALLYLESPDFGALLSRWNASPEKKAWIASDNYSVLSESRLLGRLQQAQGEFQTAAGVSPQMQLLTQLAGKESALAIYDLGNLRMVYVSRLTGQGLEANALWQQRPKYERRQVSGIDFFHQTNGGRTVAFASKGEYFVVATDVELMAQALTLMAGQSAPSLANEAWFHEIAANNEKPTLRLVFNMEQLVGKPQFRTYWIQQNITEMKQYRAGICDLYESGNAFTEKRVLLRKSPAGAATDSQAVSKLLAYVPDRHSFYQAWADPSRERLRDMLVQTVTGENSVASGEALNAPVVSTDVDSIGTAADLETRIDEPPAKPGALPAIDPAVEALAALKPVAALQIQGTTETADRVFIVPQSTLVLQFAGVNRDAIEAALGPALKALAFDGAANWQRTAAATTYGTIEPLTVTAGASPGVFVVSRGPSLADRAGGTRAVASPAPLTYAAGYNHSLAFAPYTHLFGVIDPNKEGEPSFFQNVGSLVKSLARLDSIRIREFEANSTLTEEIQYQLK